MTLCGFDVGREGRACDQANYPGLTMTRARNALLTLLELKSFDVAQCLHRPHRSSAAEANLGKRAATMLANPHAGYLTGLQQVYSVARGMVLD